MFQTKCGFFLVLVSVTLLVSAVGVDADAAESPADPSARSGDQTPRKASLPGTRTALRAGPIWLASQPDAQGLAKAKEAGVDRVITLRTTRELDFDDAELVRVAGLEFIPLRFGGHQSLTDSILDRARKILSSADENSQVLLHCASAIRVSAVWLAYRVLDDGQPISEALDEARQIGLVDPDLRDRVLEYIEQQRDASASKPR